MPDTVANPAYFFERDIRREATVDGVNYALEVYLILN